MSTTNAQADNRSFLDRNYFWLRRLHSLTGIVPIGVFLIAHLTTNSSIAWGNLARRGEGGEMPLRDGGVFYFHKEVTWINEQVPHLLLIEWTLWLSIAFHSIFGLLIAKSATYNTIKYNYGSNRRYFWQRVTGYVGILFIFYHVATLRWGWSFLVPGGTQWTHQFSASTLAAALRGGEGFTGAGLAVSVFYFVGVSMLVFHFANGLWTAAITWGLTISEKAQRQWGYACAGLGGALMLAAWASVIGFATLSPAQARKIEAGHNAALPAAEVMNSNR